MTHSKLTLGRCECLLVDFIVDSFLHFNESTCPRCVPNPWQRLSLGLREGVVTNMFIRCPALFAITNGVSGKEFGSNVSPRRKLSCRQAGRHCPARSQPFSERRNLNNDHLSSFRTEALTPRSPRRWPLMNADERQFQGCDFDGGNLT